MRIGNAAHARSCSSTSTASCATRSTSRANSAARADDSWAVEKALLGYLEEAWQLPDQGIWEVRGPPRHFTHSKVMAWVAADRAVKAVERFGLAGPVERWRELRSAIHADVCAKGFDPERNSFVQSYGSKALDAALLMIPLVGFLPPRDPRMVGTVEAIRAS